MFSGNMIGQRPSFDAGIEGSVKTLLPAGIALYGTQLVFRGLSFDFLLMIFLVFLCLFGLTLLTSNVLNINSKLAILLSSGLSVCGASAIAVISPLIGARKEDTSIAIISVMMLGLTGMIFYPVLYDVFSLTTDEFIFLTGTTLPMLGQVKVAAGNISPTAMVSALEIKLIRISFLFFLVTIALFLSGKEEKRVRVPWFIMLFLVFAILANTGASLIVPVIDIFRSASSFLLSAGLAAIGFTVDFDYIIEEGTKPVGVVFISWGVTILLIYVVRNLF
jgi:uncharacterized integral membrane protein (TIGR00698 family)